MNIKYDTVLATCRCCEHFRVISCLAMQSSPNLWMYQDYPTPHTLPDLAAMPKARSHTCVLEPALHLPLLDATAGSGRPMAINDNSKRLSQYQSPVLRLRLPLPQAAPPCSAVSPAQLNRIICNQLPSANPLRTGGSNSHIGHKAKGSHVPEKGTLDQRVTQSQAYFRACMPRT